MRRTPWQVQTACALASCTFFAISQIAAEQPLILSNSASATEEVTFNRDVAPIVFAHCSTCHRPGEVAPFSLLNYREVQKRAAQIQAGGHQKGDAALEECRRARRFRPENGGWTPEQIAIFDRWLEQGTIEGDPKDLPPLPKFRDDWRLGAPDIVITMSGTVQPGRRG